MWMWKEFSEGWARQGAWGRYLAAVVSSVPFTNWKEGKTLFFFSLKKLCRVSLNTKESLICLKILKIQKSKHEEVKPPVIMLLPVIILEVFLCISFQY